MAAHYLHLHKSLYAFIGNENMIHFQLILFSSLSLSHSSSNFDSYNFRISHALMKWYELFSYCFGFTYTHIRITFNYIRSLANCYFKCTLRLHQRFAYSFFHYKWSISPPFFRVLMYESNVFLWIKIAHSPPIHRRWVWCPKIFRSSQIDFVI